MRRRREELYELVDEEAFLADAPTETDRAHTATAPTGGVVARPRRAALRIAVVGVLVITLLTVGLTVRAPRHERPEQQHTASPEPTGAAARRPGPSPRVLRGRSSPAAAGAARQT